MAFIQEALFSISLFVFIFLLRALASEFLKLARRFFPRMAGSAVRRAMSFFILSDTSLCTFARRAMHVL